jgi:hypothetical protein
VLIHATRLLALYRRATGRPLPYQTPPDRAFTGDVRFVAGFRL